MQTFVYIVASWGVIIFWAEKNKNPSDGQVNMHFYLKWTPFRRSDLLRMLFNLLK